MAKIESTFILSILLIVWINYIFFFQVYIWLNVTFWLYTIKLHKLLYTVKEYNSLLHLSNTNLKNKQLTFIHLKIKYRYNTTFDINKFLYIITHIIIDTPLFQLTYNKN